MNRKRGFRENIFIFFEKTVWTRFGICVKKMEKYDYKVNFLNNNLFDKVWKINSKHQSHYCKIIGKIMLLNGF